MSKENGIYYLLIRGYTEFRDGDEWLGIYDCVEKLYTAYARALQDLEEERKAYEEKYGEPMDNWTLRNEKILINSFDEYNGEWKYQIEPEEIFGNMIQTINDNILDDEIRILEFSERKDKEEIIESVMGS